MAGKTIKVTKIKDLGGKAAVFVRGFGEYLLELDEKGINKVLLRKAQEAGLQAVIDKGEVMSIPYVSQLSGRLDQEGYFDKARIGKSYNCTFNEAQMDKFFDLLDGTDYGVDVGTAELSIQDMKDRNAILEHLTEHEGVVIYKERPLPKAAYKLLIDKFNKGEVVMAFVSSTNSGMLDDFPEYESDAR